MTLSQQDNADEALDTLNGAMLHYDAHYAAATAWQRPLMVSTLTLQRLIGMTSKTYGRRRAILGFDDIAMSGPLFGGDTLYAESEILDADSPDTIRTMIRGHKADGTEVARITCRMAIEGRDAAADVANEERFAAYHGADDGALVEQVGLWFEDCRRRRNIRPRTTADLPPRGIADARVALAGPDVAGACAGDVCRRRGDRAHHAHLRSRRRQSWLA